MAATVRGITHTDLNTAFGCGERFDSLLAAMVGKVIVLKSNAGFCRWEQ